MNSATTAAVKLSKDGNTVTVSSKGAKRGHTFLVATSADGIATRCEVTKADARAHLANLYDAQGWR